jgi:hypothetical protein
MRYLNFRETLNNNASNYFGTYLGQHTPLGNILKPILVHDHQFLVIKNQDNFN